MSTNGTNGAARLRRSRLVGLGVAMAVAWTVGVQAQSGWVPGGGVKAGQFRVSPFADLAVGYDSYAGLSEGEQPTQTADGTYQYGSTENDDFFTQFAVGLGISRAMESEWDLRARAWYDTRLYMDQTDVSYDSVTAETALRFWPASDKFLFRVGGKYRLATDVERTPVSAPLTMPGEQPLPFLEERYDRMKRTTLDGHALAEFRALARTDFSIGGQVSSVDYDDAELYDYLNWSLSGTAGYRLTEKTSFFGVMEYRMVDGDSLSSRVPVYALRAGFRSRPLEKVDYRISVGAKTYKHYEDSEGLSKDRRTDIDFDGLLTWRYSEKLNLFGNARTDVGAAVQESENTRRTYSGQLGFDYACLKRVNLIGSASYRLDDYDFPIRYGDDQEQDQTELWKFLGRVELNPRAKAFWKLFLESSYETGDNSLDTYDQWLVFLGASVWY